MVFNLLARLSSESCINCRMGAASSKKFCTDAVIGQIAALGQMALIIATIWGPHQLHLLGAML